MRWRFGRKQKLEQDVGGEGDGSEHRADPSADSRLVADDPIEDVSEDLLRRGPFAQAIARTVERAPRASGFVIAVTGGWGDGKTSVLNMAAKELERAGSADVVRFNPWLFSGTEQLVGHFFAELAGQLPQDDDRRKQAATALASYAKVVSPLKVVPVIGQVLEASGQMAQGASDILAPTPPSIHETATRLRAALANLDRPVAILIDDIDRLRNDEIADLMRLVRLVGDFPNLTYVLALERRRVEEALGGSPDHVATGRAYIEKIIQVSYELPPVSPEALDDAITKRLDHALGDTSRLTFSETAYVNVYANGFRRLFRSLRDAHRFGNALPAAIELLGTEVEVSDILALEGLRIFEPDVFAAIEDSLDVLTTPSGLRTGGDPAAETEERKKQLAALVGAAGRPGVVEALIAEIFPASRRYRPGGSHFGAEWESTWQRERRVASREVLEVYLARNLPPGTVALSVIRGVLESFDDRPRLADILDGLDADELEQLFRRLEDYEGNFKSSAPERAIEALLDTRGRLRSGKRHMFDLGAELALRRVLLRILRGRSQEDIDRIVEAVKIDDLGAREMLIDLVGHSRGSGAELVSKEAATHLEQALAHDVLDASVETLRREPALMRLLALASRFEPDAVRERVAEWVRDPEFLVAWLRSAVLESVGQTLGRADIRRSYQLNWPALLQYMSQSDLAALVRSHDDAVQAYLDDDIKKGAWKQARLYADDPDRATQDLSRWQAPGGDEQPDGADETPSPS